jgi:hypothetical protein
MCSCICKMKIETTPFRLQQLLHRHLHFVVGRRRTCILGESSPFSLLSLSHTSNRLELRSSSSLLHTLSPLRPSVSIPSRRKEEGRRQVATPAAQTAEERAEARDVQPHLRLRPLLVPALAGEVPPQSTTATRELQIRHATILSPPVVLTQSPWERTRTAPLPRASEILSERGASAASLEALRPRLA